MHAMKYSLNFFSKAQSRREIKQSTSAALDITTKTTLAKSEIQTLNLETRKFLLHVKQINTMLWLYELKLDYYGVTHWRIVLGL